MLRLLGEHFDGVTREQFESDLAEKSHAILLWRDERLVGFSTLLSYERTFRAESLRIIYSGDTIVTPDAWGTTALPRAWIGAVNKLREGDNRRWLWLLLTSGFRTYRFLPVFWREFWPRFDASDCAATRQLLEFLARDKFGSEFDPAMGIVRFHRPQRLRENLRGLPSERLDDPHIRFFAEQNPGHELGDELVCLTELSSENLTAAGRRMVRNSERDSDIC
jgi:hypothetical protein